MLHTGETAGRGTDSKTRVREMHVRWKVRLLQFNSQQITTMFVCMVEYIPVNHGVFLCVNIIKVRKHDHLQITSYPSVYA